MSLYALAFVVVLAAPFAHAQADDDAVLKRFDERIQEGKDWLRSHRENDAEWARRDSETWKLEKGRDRYRICKKDPETCEGS